MSLGYDEFFRYFKQWVLSIGLPRGKGWEKEDAERRQKKRLGILEELNPFPDQDAIKAALGMRRRRA